MLDGLLNRFPAHAAGWHELGLTLQRANQPEAALLALARAAKAAPSGPYRLREGAALQALGRIEEAIIALRAAIGLAPDLLEASLALAACLREAGDPAADPIRQGLPGGNRSDQRRCQRRIAAKDDAHRRYGAP